MSIAYRVFAVVRLGRSCEPRAFLVRIDPATGEPTSADARAEIATPDPALLALLAEGSVVTISRAESDATPAPDVPPSSPGTDAAEGQNRA